MLPLLKDYKNLVIMRTLSKIGLAGLRVGFLIADKEIINEVNKVRLPFNLNSLSQAIAVEALKDKKTLQSHINAIVSEREKLFNEMEKISGMQPYPSEANFILFKVNNPDRVYKSLLRKGVLVRNMKGVVDGCLRVTIGTPGRISFSMPLLKDYKNLVIMRTLSKIGLAGLRVGFLIADREIINEVNKVRLPFNLNSLSQAIAVEALKDRKTISNSYKSDILLREKNCLWN